MAYKLEGKTLLITGSSRGIGFAIAETALQNGAKVCLHYNKTKGPVEKLHSKYPKRSFLLNFELNDLSSIDDGIEKLKEEFENINVLINNAGIAIESAPTMPGKEWITDWKNTFDVNIHGHAYLIHHFLKAFREKKDGTIINISSRASHRGETADFMAYGASKAALHNITKSIARSFGKDNIKAFNVCPGFTRTEMAQQFIEAYGEDFIIKDQALEQMTEPKDVANMVCFLASGMADQATSSSFDINAGSYIR